MVSIHLRESEKASICHGIPGCIWILEKRIKKVWRENSFESHYWKQQWCNTKDTIYNRGHMYSLIINKSFFFWILLCPENTEIKVYVSVWVCVGGYWGAGGMQCADSGKRSRSRKISLWSQKWSLRGAGQGQKCGQGSQEDWIHGQEMVKKKAGTGLLSRGWHLKDWFPPFQPQGLMGVDLPGFPDSVLIRGAWVPIGDSALVNLSEHKRRERGLTFPQPLKVKEKAFFTFRAISWMTEVSVCNWSVWAQAFNYFLDNLLSISHQAACQNMLMSPEFLGWILRIGFVCFVLFCFWGYGGVGVQAAVSPTGRKAVLSSALSCAEWERMPRNLGHSRCWCPCGTWQCLLFLLAPWLHAYRIFSFTRTFWKSFWEKVWSWYHLLREQGNSWNNLLFGGRRVRNVSECNRPAFPLNRSRTWPSPR